MIDQVFKDWPGTLPATFVYDKKGKMTFHRLGIIDRDVLVAEIEKALAKDGHTPAATAAALTVQPDSMRVTRALKSSRDMGGSEVGLPWAVIAGGKGLMGK